MTKQIKSTYCDLLIAAEGNKIIRVRGDATHPSCFARPCPNGAMVHLTAQPDYRLRHSKLGHERTALRQRVGWGQALGRAVRGFVQIIKAHGPDRTAFYFFRQLLSDDCYLFKAESVVSGAKRDRQDRCEPLCGDRRNQHHGRTRPSAKRWITGRAGRTSFAIVPSWRKLCCALKALWARRGMPFGMDLNAELL